MEIYKNSGNRILFGVVTGALIIAIAIYLGLQSDQAEAPAMQGEADINKWEDDKEDVFSRLTKLEGGITKHGAKLDELWDKSSYQRPDLSGNKYSATVRQVGGVGSRLLTKEAWDWDEGERIDPEKYISVYINRPADGMNVSCITGFRITSCISPSGNFTHLIYASTCQTILEDKLQNSLMLTCERE